MGSGGLIFLSLILEAFHKINANLKIKNVIMTPNFI